MTTKPRYTRKSRMLRRIWMLEDEMAQLDRTYRKRPISAHGLKSDAEVEQYGKALSRRVERAKEERQRNAP